MGIFVLNCRVGAGVVGAVLGTQGRIGGLGEWSAVLRRDFPVWLQEAGILGVLHPCVTHRKLPHRALQARDGVPWVLQAPASTCCLAPPVAPCFRRAGSAAPGTCCGPASVRARGRKIVSCRVLALQEAWSRGSDVKRHSLEP